jgi:hypothetical protein
MSQLFHSCPEVLIITGQWFILARGSVEIDDHTGPSFTQPKAADNVIYGISLRFGREEFFSRRSFRI